MKRGIFQNIHKTQLTLFPLHFSKCILGSWHWHPAHGHQVGVPRVPTAGPAHPCLPFWASSHFNFSLLKIVLMFSTRNYSTLLAGVFRKPPQSDILCHFCHSCWTDSSCLVTTYASVHFLNNFSNWSAPRCFITTISGDLDSKWSVILSQEFILRVSFEYVIVLLWQDQRNKLLGESGVQL